MKGEQIKNLLSANKGKPTQVGQIYGTEKEANPQAGNRMPKIAIAILDDQGRVNKYHHLKDICPTLRAEMHGNIPKIVSLGNVNPSGSGHGGEVYYADGLAPTITTGKGEGPKIAIPILTPDRTNKRQNGRRFKNPGEEMFTLTAQDRHGVMLIYQRPRGHNKGGLRAISPTLTSNDWQNNNLLVIGFILIRKLTPKECWRLQSFPDESFEKASSVNSDSQLYKQAGNSVTVNVVYEIAKRLKELEGGC